MKTKSTFLQHVNKVRLINYLEESGGDGWSINDPSYYTDIGFKLEDLPVQTYKSNTSDPKSTLFDNEGKVLKQLKGVYNLTFLRKLAREIGAESNTGMLGRGFEAQALTRNIRKVLKTYRF